MPKKPRSKAEVLKVKKNILTKALKILVDEGYDNLSMSKLGKRTKMTAANLYNYYSSKDELYSAIIITGYNQLYDTIEEALKSSETSYDKASATLNSLYHFGMKNPHYHYLMFTMIAPKYSDYVGTPMEPIAKEELENAFRVLNLCITTIAEYMEGHSGYSKMAPQLVTMQFWSQVHGIVSLYNSGNLIEADENAKEITLLMMQNILITLKNGYTN